MPVVPIPSFLPLDRVVEPEGVGGARLLPRHAEGAAQAERVDRLDVVERLFREQPGDAGLGIRPSR